jgi:hypothetical protein
LIDNNNTIRLFVFSFLSYPSYSLSKNKPSTRSVSTTRFAKKGFDCPYNFYDFISEAARRIAVSGIPILARPQTAPLMKQENNMTVDRKQARIRRCVPVLPRISINQLPRIQRRADAPPRPKPKPKTQEPNPTSSSFIDRLLNAQKHLHSSQNIQMQG